MTGRQNRSTTDWMLQQFLSAHRAELVDRCDAAFLDELIEALQLGLPDHATLVDITAAVASHVQRRDAAARERLGRFAHELRNHLNSAFLAYEMVKMGTVDITGTTGELLGRSLEGLRTAIDRELA